MTGLDGSITAKAAHFVASLQYQDLETNALHIARRCMIDTMGLYTAGLTEHSLHILVDEALDTGGREDAVLLGAGDKRVPAPMAARVMGTAAHAHDWDDTQVSHDPAHVYGLLMHPSAPPLTAALVMAQKTGNTSGKDVMTAFQAGYEIGCKVSEWTRPDLYRKGLHTSGVVGTLAAAASAARIMQLDQAQIATTLGIAGSMASGIRANFGTMTKPLHVGRAVENGVTAALLAARGYTADPEILDGRWGFPTVLGGGFTESKLSEGFGAPLTMVEPGVSIKPYPSGILTHQSMDAMRDLVFEHDLKPEEVSRIDFYAANNIIEPIRYPIAKNHLQAKFSMPALLAMMVIRRQAGRREFVDEFVAGQAMQAMQACTHVHLDPDIEAMGFDRIRSRIEVTTHDGRVLVQWADERYRGGPSKPMTDPEVEEKFRLCTDGLLDAQRQRKAMDQIWAIDELDDISELIRTIQLDAPVHD